MARIVSIKSMTIDSTGANPIPLVGVVSANFSEKIAEKIGQSDGEVFETSVNPSGFSGDGSIVTDSYDNDLVLLTGSIVILAITYAKAGGTTGVITIGGGTPPNMYGAVITDVGETVFDIGESSGPTVRQQFNFIITGLDTHVQLITEGTNTGPIVIT